MMKPDTDIEKYNDASLTRIRMKNRNHGSHRFFYSCVSCVSWIILITDRNAIRHKNGVMGQWVDEKNSYYTFPPTNCKFPSLSCTFTPFK